jgi:hypothetical protein
MELPASKRGRRAAAPSWGAEIRLRVMIRQLIIILFATILNVKYAESQPLSYDFKGKYGQVEVGGRYVGAEFHGSRPLPSRISFYYPVANSTDLSTDYWKRGESQPMVVGVRFRSGKKHWLGKEGWAYTLSPQRVTFRGQDGILQYELTYRFCINEPAMVMTLTIKNTGLKSVPVEVYTHLKTILRTCQTYAWKNSAWTQFDSSHASIIVNFDDSDAYRASLFVQNVGEYPVSWTSSASELGATDSGTSNWISSLSGLRKTSLPATSKGLPIAAFIYRRVINPSDSLAIIQIIGSCNRDEVLRKIYRLASSWHEEVLAYDQFVLQKVNEGGPFVTGEKWLDRSATWALGLLASNQHYLDGKIVPMPCPAEYNFFFTHDLLLTNLGAVNFDLGRVKRDLLYIVSLAKDNIIPHAYYWRDDGYKTEFCTPENWNHLWFVLITARYLQHSNDDSTGQVLLPLVTRSLNEILTQRKKDNLMYAYRPDWWDIGRREGPRAYITSLTIRALRDYLYISSFLNQRSPKLLDYERLADEMQRALGDWLWDDSLNYLINYNDTMKTLKDKHYYIGSLVAPVYGVLDPQKSKKLVETASKKLLRYPVGVMVVSPPDFHTDSMRAFFKFVNNEAGDPFYYINGGIWPHANAIYALALNAIGRTDDAMKFVKNVMTIDGIAKSPNGLPAMYEYRYADSSSKEFGKIDKPSFMWAAGFYMNVLYQLCGFQNNEWNLSLSGRLPPTLDSVYCTYSFGDRCRFTIRGKADRLRSFLCDGKEIPSLVLPLEIIHTENLTVEYGIPKIPYIENVNAILHNVAYEPNSMTLKMKVSSFKGHEVNAGIVTPLKIKEAIVDGVPIPTMMQTAEPDGMVKVQIKFIGSDSIQHIEIHFKNL